MQSKMLNLYYAIADLFARIEEKNISLFNIVASDHKAIRIPDTGIILYLFRNGVLKIEQRSGVCAYSLEIDRSYLPDADKYAAYPKLLPEFDNLDKISKAILPYLAGLAKDDR